MTNLFYKAVLWLVLLTSLCLVPSIAKAKTVGIIMTHGSYDHARIHESLVSYLEKKGYSDKIKFLAQRPYPDPIAFSNAARKLIASDVDIIITYGVSPTIAVLRERPRIPVLYAGVYEPIASEIKGKTMTGVCSKLNISSLVRYLRASKTIQNLGVVYYSLEKDSDYQMTEIRQISEKYGLAVSPLDLKHKADLPEMLSNADIDALIITSSDTAGSSLSTILGVASARKIPTASMITSDKASAMISLTSDPKEQGTRLGKMLIGVMQGQSAQSITPVCGRKIELVYNVKDANRMGLKISMDLITEATRLINQ
jgi:putative ABC transport system substrate-binding protein